MDQESRRKHSTACAILNSTSWILNPRPGNNVPVHGKFGRSPSLVKSVVSDIVAELQGQGDVGSLDNASQAVQAKTTQNSDFLSSTETNGSVTSTVLVFDLLPWDYPASSADAFEIPLVLALYYQYGGQNMELGMLIGDASAQEVAEALQKSNAKGLIALMKDPGGLSNLAAGFGSTRRGGGGGTVRIELGSLTSHTIPAYNVDPSGGVTTEYGTSSDVKLTVEATVGQMVTFIIDETYTT